MTVGVSQQDDLYNAVGATGGIILAGSFVPQIIRAHRRRSAEDISYMWQGVFISGLVTLMVYYVHYELWSVFFPLAGEFSCVVYLTILKFYFETVAGKGTAATSPQLKVPLVGESTSVTSTASSQLEVPDEAGRFANTARPDQH